MPVLSYTNWRAAGIDGSFVGIVHDIAVCCLMDTVVGVV